MYLYGGDYNPEQWDDQVRAEDLTLMRAASVNLATVGVFSWSALEPQAGRYDFADLDRTLDDLHRAEVGVALATPTASPPPWFTRAHPDALAQTRDGVRLVHGSRDTYCVNAPAYRAACIAIATELGRRYAGHPALRLWHVHNEYGTWCFCDNCAVAFRRWLQDRYQHLDALNEAWTSAFWSQGYGDWADILPPRATQYLHNPAQTLDYRRFLSDSMLAAYIEQRDVLKAAGPTPVTTNFVLGAWPPVDHARWASEVDLVAIDHYPSSLDGAVAQSAFAADAARGWATAAGHPDSRWLLMEHAPSTVTDNGVQRAKPPGMMARIALGHLARGSIGALFFQWRASRGGAEQWHPAVVPHAGPDSRVFREAVELGRLLRSLPPRGGAGIKAQIAIWYDEQCGWAIQGAHLPVDGFDYQSAVGRMHAAASGAGFAVDVVPPPSRPAEGADQGGSGLGSYRLVIVPAAYLMTAQSAQLLREFVEAGGHLLVSYLSGIVDEHARVWLGGYPGALRDLLGVRTDEFDPLPAGASVQLDSGEQTSGWIERCVAVDAAVELSHRDGAALTRRQIGAGVARYLACEPDERALARIVEAAGVEAGVAPASVGLPAGVEEIRSHGVRWLFNHSDQPAVVEVEPGDKVTLAAGEVQAHPL